MILSQRILNPVKVLLQPAQLFGLVCLACTSCLTQAPSPATVNQESLPQQSTKLGSSTIIEPTQMIVQEEEALIATFTPVPAPTKTPQPDGQPASTGKPGTAFVNYIAQPGDTLSAIAKRFAVQLDDIQLSTDTPENQLLIPGQTLFIPSGSEELRSSMPQVSAPWIIPDSEVVFGPSAKDFSAEEFLFRTNGYLREYQEWLESTGWTSAGQVIERVALENSINPRLLISLLEWECGCVTGKSEGELASGYVIGVEDYHRKTLYGQLSWMARSLADGYYSWRLGELPADFDANLVGQHLSPDLNAGTIALLTYFSRLKQIRMEGSRPIPLQDWEEALNPESGVSNLHSQLFGDPWQRDRQSEPILPQNLTQPAFVLPFEPDWVWSLTSGPHPAWENAGALSALDFAPAANESGCAVSPTRVVAVADGPVVRSKFGVVVQDIEVPGGPLSDQYEGTGWTVVYLHIDDVERVPDGTYLHTGDPIGHPSCEGGPSTGTHLHIARKYNGEWIAADGPLPFVLGGWTAHQGENPYEGSLTRDDLTVIANVFGIKTSWIERSQGPEETEKQP